MVLYPVHGPGLAEGLALLPDVELITPPGDEAVVAAVYQAP